MPLVSQSADRGQTKERANAIWQANGRLKLTELISKTFRNKKKKMSFFILFSFFSIRNLDSFELCGSISFKTFFFRRGRHSLDMCWFQSKVPTSNGPLVLESSQTVRSWNFLISVSHFCWPHSNSSWRRQILGSPSVPVMGTSEESQHFNRATQTVLSFVVQMSRLSWAL